MIKKWLWKCAIPTSVIFVAFYSLLYFTIDAFNYYGYFNWVIPFGLLFSVLMNTVCTDWDKDGFLERRNK